MSIKRIAKARRFRSAKSDAFIGSIQNVIEVQFGLPQGSVRLIYPGGRKARIDAHVGALRRHWDRKSECQGS